MITNFLSIISYPELRYNYSFPDIELGFSNCMKYMKSYHEKDTTREHWSTAKNYYKDSESVINRMPSTKESLERHTNSLLRLESARAQLVQGIADAISGAVTGIISKTLSSSHSSKASGTSASIKTKQASKGSSAFVGDEDDPDPGMVEKRTPCPTCDGTGRMREITLHGDYYKTCTGCHGTGYRVRYESAK